MKALILAAGYGRRLYPLTKNLPKALLPIKDKPVIEYIIEKLEYIDVSRIYVITNDRFFLQLEDWKNSINFKDYAISIEIINDYTKSDDDKLGAIGDIDFVIRERKVQEDLIIIAGDNLFEFGLDKFVSFSQKNSEFPTVGIKQLDCQEMISKYGVVKLNEHGHIIEFEEKPEQPESDLVAIGIYFFPSGTLNLVSEYLEEGNNPDATGYLIEWLCKNNVVYGYIFSDAWYDIGSVEGYRRAGGDLI